MGKIDSTVGRTMQVNGKETEESKNMEINENYKGWKVMPFIIGNETFEKLGATGTLSNLLIYLTTVFNMKSVTAATTINIFNGTTNFATLLGAYLSDTYFGRYNTLGFSTVMSFLGLLLICLTAAISKLHPSHCANESVTCEGPTPGQLAFLLAAFGLMIIGAGGVRPCNLAFGADQFNPETESGKRGINSFFNWYFFTFTFAQMISLTLIVYIQANVSWAIGLAIPAILMLIACVLFFTGSKMYVKVKATGSPMTSVAQVIAVSIKKRRLKLVDQPWLALFNHIPLNSINAKLSYTDQFRFLNKAAIKTEEDETNPDGSSSDPWKLCSMQQVEEVKCLMRVMPIWISAVIFHIALGQQHTYAVFQAVQSDRRLGNSKFEIPAASFNVFLMISLSIFIPVYDRILVPFMQRITGKQGGITMLQRIGIGLIISVISMIISGVIEERRRTIALTKPTLGIAARRGDISSMSSLWLIIQLAIAGLAEAFGAIGLVEFYYKQFPENMRSIAGALFFCGMAGASYASSFLITIVHKTTGGSTNGNWLSEDLNKGRLDYYYYMIACIGAFNFAYFLVCAHWFKYKGGEDGSIHSIEIATQKKQSEKSLLKIIIVH